MTFSNSLSLYLKSLRTLIPANLFVLVLMTGFRVAFYFLYRNPLETAGFSSDLLQAFWLGLRFDLMILAYVNSFPVLYLMLSAATKQRVLYQAFSYWAPLYYSLFFTWIIFIMGVDLGYYSYFQDRINVLIWGFLRDDTQALIRTFWKNYPVVWTFLGIGLLIFGFYKQLRSGLTKLVESSTPRKNPALWFAFWFTPFVMVFLAARGTLSMYPLGPMHTQISTNSFINQIPFNGAYSFTRALTLGMNQKHERDANIKAFGYQGKRDQAFADYFGIPVEKAPEHPFDLMKKKTAVNPWAEQTRPHVVLLVLEGWSAYWTQYSSPSFNLLGEFKKHSEEDLFFKKFLPGSGSTIGSLSNILIGSTQRARAPFLTESELLQVHFRTSPADVFKKAGYTTRFLYAGSTGWRDVGKFASYQGYDIIEGEVEIEKRFGKNSDMVHDWGIHDEAIFNYIKATLDEATTPQFFVVMTTTNHPPYFLPKSFKNPPPQVPAEVESTLVGDRTLVHGRLRAFQYTNEKLGEFMTSLKNSPLAAKTIVAATGDHSFWIVNHSELQPLQKYAVPFYIYVPQAGKPKFADTNRFGSHLSIFPSLYDLSLSKTEYFSFGKSLFAEVGPFYAYHSNEFALNDRGGVSIFGENATFTKWNGDFSALQFIPEGSPELQEMHPLAVSYRSLMSLLDFYYEKERKREE